MNALTNPIIATIFAFLEPYYVQTESTSFIAMDTVR